MCLVPIYLKELNVYKWEHSKVYMTSMEFNCDRYCPCSQLCNNVVIIYSSCCWLYTDRFYEEYMYIKLHIMQWHLLYLATTVSSHLLLVATFLSWFLWKFTCSERSPAVCGVLCPKFKSIEYFSRLFNLLIKKNPLNN